MRSDDSLQTQSGRQELGELVFTLPWPNTSLLDTLGRHALLAIGEA
jgi:hypothetical protein